MERDLWTWVEGRHAVFSRSEAERMGISDGMLRGWAQRGRVETLGHGVFRIPGAPRTWEQSVMTEVLGAGVGAAAAMSTAAALLDVPGYRREGPPTLIVPGHRNRPGCRESYKLPTHHVFVIEGIPTTVPARLAFDMFGKVVYLRAARLADHLVNHKHTDDEELIEMLGEMQRRGRKGTRAMRAYVEARAELADRTESELEDLVLAVLEDAGLPRPECQVELFDEDGLIGRVDCLFRRARLVLEVDSRAWHGSWNSAIDDRRRDARLLAAGYSVIRVTHWQLVNEPKAFSRSVRSVIAQAG